ncbi:MAG TPA: PDZ domain-containing protein [Firmicutes bacterium]|nr:PDZ domain-containing protein [Bacillota bacterium]
MDFYDEFDQPPRRGSSAVTCLLAGLLGGIVGAALFWLLSGYYFPPVQEPAEFSPSPTNRLEITGGNAAALVVEKAKPAVVGVTNYVNVYQGGQKVVRERGSGSGAIISADGYIVTNQHVIDQADEIAVFLPNAEILTAELVGEDALTDLALLKIDRDELSYLSLGDSTRIKVGETSIAIGNPLKYFQQTVTVGVVSAVERQVSLIDSSYSYTYIQTDAAINAGNSGGPLVNLGGEIIGINSAKIKDVGVEGIGFAIPSNTVKRVVKDLREYGRVKRPQLGILVRDLAQQTQIVSDLGVYVDQVVSGSPAQAGGLQEGDVIIKVEDQEVNYSAQLFDALLKYYPGDKINLSVLRNGTPDLITVELAEMK